MEKSSIHEWGAALRSWRIWYSLAIQDILLRYRGSTLGPLWIALSTAITVYSMGYLYGILFAMDRQNYLPYFASGVIAWNLISMIVNESTKIALESRHYMQNIHLPFIVYMFRLVFRNVIIFVHNLLVYISVVFVFHVHVDASILWLIPGVFILSLNAIFYGTAIAFISARFSDVGVMISNLLQVFFFLTPIMWMPSALPSRFGVFLALNPFVYFVNLLRNPLLSLSFTREEIVAVSVLTVFGFALFATIHRVYRSRIIFWV
jgi:ABC-type polysaccharide/polyol phosphate export permease